MLILPQWAEFSMPEEGGEIPAVILHKQQLPFVAQTEYWTLDTAVGVDPPGPKDWSVNRKGDMVRVPISSYLLAGPQALDAWAGGLEVAMRALEHWCGRMGQLPLGLVLAIGHGRIPQPPDRQRQFLGLVFALPLSKG